MQGGSRFIAKKEEVVYLAIKSHRKRNVLKHSFIYLHPLWGRISIGAMKIKRLQLKERMALKFVCTKLAGYAHTRKRLNNNICQQNVSIRICEKEKKQIRKISSDCWRYPPGKGQLYQIRSNQKDGIEDWIMSVKAA